jgi:hypothetical protein
VADLVTLPSGAVAPLEAPDLAALLSSSGGVAGVARSAFAHDEVDAEDLAPDDLFAVASWALRAFLETGGAALLGELGAAYGLAPSVRFGLAGDLLGVSLDLGCLVAWQESSREQRRQPEGERSDQAVRFTTGGPG